MIIECPQCYSNVLLKSDDTCPACHASVGSSANAPPVLTKVSLRQSTLLPGICVTCGRETASTVSFKRWVRNPRYFSKPAMMNVLALVLTPLLDYLLGRTGREIALRIPQCETCVAEKCGLHVLNIDFETAITTLVVRREFKDALKADARPGA
jgi:hypothetical protein